MRRSPLFVVVVVSALSLSIICGGVGIAVAETDDPPGEPAAFYGAATEADGTEIPVGAEIVAVVNGSVEDEITVETAGKYGGPGTFDDKLRVDSTAGEEVTFRLVGPNGSSGGTAALESGVSEENLTFPEGSIATLPPTPAIEVDPTTATAGGPIVFSATNSIAYGGSELVGFEWRLERDGESTATFEGENSTRSVDEPGEYDVILTVTDSDGRTATETSDLEIEADDSNHDTDAGGDSTGAGGGGGSGGGSSGGGGTGTGSSGGGSGGSTGTGDGGSNGTETSSTNETGTSAVEHLEPPLGGIDPTEDEGDSRPERSTSETADDRGTPEPTDPRASAGAGGFDPTSPIVPLAALVALLVAVAAIGRRFIPRQRDRW